VDRSKVNAPHQPYLGPPIAQPSSELVMGRLGTYWSSLGVSDPNQITALSEQALHRATELPDTPGLDLLARAMWATHDLLDDWLARTLDLPRHSRQVVAARAALLSGAVPNWPSSLFAPPGETEVSLDILRDAIAQPTPTPAPAAMPTQRIKALSALGLFRLLWRKLFGA
jgi:hypothetical protein